MAPISLRPRHADTSIRTLLALVCAALLVPGEGALLAQEAATPARRSAAKPAPVKLPPDQLDSLVAPIALYPDPLLAQTLVASTYPLEIMQLQQWLAKHKDLKDKALADAVAKQPWDPSIQSMAPIPDVVKRLCGRHPVDDGSRERLPRPAERRHGRRPADAEEGPGEGRPEVQRAAEGRDEGRRAEDGHRRRALEPRGHLRPVVQPDGRLPAADLPLPADLLPAPASCGRRVRLLHGRRHDRRGRLGRLVLRLPDGAPTTPSTST